jgi:hypothetical protein
MINNKIEVNVQPMPQSRIVINRKNLQNYLDKYGYRAHI